MAANIMDTDKMGSLNLETWGSQRLRCLAEQLQYYKPPITLDGLEEEAKDSDVDIVFHLRFPESTAENTQLPCVRARERRAAVLICVFEGDHGELRVILTKRSNNLSSHPGEVALPGGKKDEGDEDDSATALREAREEIGLDPALVRVVAYLEPFISKHLLRVTPVVGLLARREDFMPILNVDEVDAIFDAPLEMFLKLSSNFFEDILDSIIVDVASECHRIARLGLDRNLEEEEEELRLSAQARVKVADPNNSGVENSKHGVDIFGQNHPAVASEIVECMNCGRSITAGKFAPHMEKCMGKGRKARPKATRSSTAAQNHYLRGSPVSTYSPYSNRVANGSPGIAGEDYAEGANEDP